MLKKGRGLRKRTRGAPDEPESPESTTPEVSTPDASTAEVSAAEAVPAAPDPEPIPEPVAAETVFYDQDTVADEAPGAEAEAETPAEPEPLPQPEVEAPEPVAAEAVPSGLKAPDEPTPDDEPPLPPRRPAPEPEGPVLETAKLPDVPVASGAKPLTLPRVIAIANQKGGVGKTTTTVNLGAALAEIGFRVLVLDLDPQGNASTGLGLNPRDVEGSVYDVLLNDAALADIIEPTSLKNLFVAPATIDLAGAEIELVPVMSRELKLKKAIGLRFVTTTTSCSSIARLPQACSR